MLHLEILILLLVGTVLLLGGFYLCLIGILFTGGIGCMAGDWRALPVLGGGGVICMYLGWRAFRRAFRP